MKKTTPITFQKLPREGGLFLLIAKQGDEIVAFETFTSDHDAEAALIVAQSALVKMIDNLRDAVLA